MNGWTPRLVLTPLLLIASTVVMADAVSVRPPALDVGDTWTMMEIEPGRLPVFEPGWEGRTFWDLRPTPGDDRQVRWTVRRPVDAGLAAVAAQTGADRALCAVQESSDRDLNCRLVKRSEIGPTGPRAHKVDSSRRRGVPLRFEPGLERDRVLSVGDAYQDAVLADGEPTERIYGRAVAEGVALVPAGPREVVLLREMVELGNRTRLVYRFLSTTGEPVALFEGVVDPDGLFLPTHGEVLTTISTRADDGLEIAYQDLSDALQPGSTGFLQYSFEGEPCFDDTDCTHGTCIGATADPGGCQAPLSDFESSWTTVGAMTSIDQTGVSYQPDPGDPSTQQTLAEVWDLSGLAAGNLQHRTFNTTRDDTAWTGSCLTGCATKDVTANPPDGTWQSYLKIDRYTSLGAQYSRDIFQLNDNDTDGNPSIDVPFVAQDELNVSDRTQICFEDSGGAASERLLRFFQFTGASPAVATLGAGDTWTSGNWTSCNSSSGLFLTLASACDDLCYPGCNAITDPKARGMLGAGVGLSSEIVEDGFVLMPTGNYIPALLMAQITDIEAGANLLGTCNIGTQRNRAIDYFWLHEKYGLLASISSPNDDGTCSPTLTPTDWSCFNDRTDGVDFTWGPYPPYQTEAKACLNGTLIEWSLPADGSNLNGEPGISDYGYVVAWGSATDPKDLTDFGTNPNHSPLPGVGGYLAAPAGSEPTSYVITGWGGASINATVVTTLRYTDPDAGDTTTYQSAAFYKVVENPARLDSMVFQVGDSVSPFSSISGNDVVLNWPAVTGAQSYLIRVYDLATKMEIPCPPGMDCTPTSTTTTHPNAWATGDDYGYRAFAIDLCGDPSTN